jgi:hypothetical protein
MRTRLAGRRIAIGAHIRLGQNVADGVVGEALGEIDTNRRRSQPIEIIIGEALRHAMIGVAAIEQVAYFSALVDQSGIATHES